MSGAAVDVGTGCISRPSSLQWVLSGYRADVRRLLALGRPRRRLARPAAGFRDRDFMALSSLADRSPAARARFIGGEARPGPGRRDDRRLAVDPDRLVFAEGRDRHKALGAWAGARWACRRRSGMILGGCSRRGSGWRMGVLRQPADVRARADRRVPAVDGGAEPRVVAEFRRGWRRARHRRHAAAGLRAGERPRRRRSDAGPRRPASSPAPRPAVPAFLLNEQRRDPLARAVDLSGLEGLAVANATG